MGYINFGTAVNNMCVDIIHPKLTCDDIWSCDTSLLQYAESCGIKRLREAFARIFTELLETHVPVLSENIFCVAGVTSCIDLIAHCLADPGEVFLVPTPMYGRINTNLKQRAQVDVWPVPVITADSTEDFPVLTLDKIISAYESAKACHRVVRGIFLINPNNPLGDVYSPQLLMDIMSFCQAHSLHLIVDEVYALSVFSKSQKFHSVLKFCKLPNPEMTHVLYGLSKDFAVAGLRVGVIHTTCEPLKKCLTQLAFFQNIPFPVMDITARFLEDIEWLKKYIAINQQRMAEAFEFCVDYFEKNGLKVRSSPAGFFLWIDFRSICGSSFDKERHFFEYVFDKAHVYIGPGKEFFCQQPGWFRIIFTKSQQTLREGLRRLEKAIKEYKPLDS